ncbi:hypothetical protein DCAR_0103066 [Daucus carota subsp. sativus]|uniref:Uncharacterized protein n=1 Tax=Daucus carota subsp. sativus TaxID=79200 RepID=A0A166HHP6_DAUCS|nr:PREDICTED: protein NIM1-INTERACTING 1-like [Daucus carota subsp. sativus]WOG83888.1 hypothetical protein DCAR_0103066 [Daucus carota subsp. sativus]
MSTEKSPEEDHEAKDMEKFFALIKNYREARDRRVQELDAMNKKRKCSGTDKITGWMPSFEWEDFRHENAEILRKSIRMVPPPAAATRNASPNCATNGSSVSDTQGEKEEDGLDLDLKLCL